MESNTADFLESMALAEALCFEDFELGMKFGTSYLNNSRGSCSNRPMVVCAKNDSRLFVSDVPFKQNDAFRGNAIFVVTMIEEQSDMAIEHVGRMFVSLAERGLRSCLCYRASCAPGAIAKTSKARQGVEWSTPYSDGRYLSGLVLSDLWREGAAFRAARTVRRFLAALAPSCHSANDRLIIPASYRA